MTLKTDSPVSGKTKSIVQPLKNATLLTGLSIFFVIFPIRSRSG